MKNIFNRSLFFIFPAILLLAACTHSESCGLQSRLNCAESIMYQYPDSALALLREMPVPARSDSLQHATWCLLITHAAYKCYVKQPSDSLINLAHSYFMKQENAQRRALTLYLKGVLHEEQHEFKEALENYLAAAKEVDKTEDYQLAHLIYKIRGNLFLYQDEYVYAEDAFWKSLSYAELAKDESYECDAWRCLARVYSSCGNYIKSVEYYNASIEISERTGNLQDLSNCLRELGGVYTAMQLYAKALECIDRSIQIKAKANQDIKRELYVKGRLYVEWGKKDSVTYYLEEALKFDNVYTQRGATYYLYEFNKEEKKYEQALSYLEKYNLYKDSLQKQVRNEALIEMQEKYNQEKVINEKNRLKAEKNRVIRNLLLGLVLLFFAIIIVILINRHLLIQKQKVIREHEEETREYMFRMHENNSIISQSANRIAELTRQIAQRQGMCEQLQDQLQEQLQNFDKMQQLNNLLNEENEALQRNMTQNTVFAEEIQLQDLLHSCPEILQRRLKRENYLLGEMLNQTEIVKKIKKKPAPLSNADWEKVYDTVDQLFDNFTKRLPDAIDKCSVDDIKLCCLIKLHLSISEIGDVFGISPHSISKRKVRLKERIKPDVRNTFGKEKNKLDLWVWRY